jgi:hypothetical protein
MAEKSLVLDMHYPENAEFGLKKGEKRRVLP